MAWMGWGVGGSFCPKPAAYRDVRTEAGLRNEVFAARLNTPVSTCVQHSSNNVIIVNWMKLRVWAGVEKGERWV